MSERPPARVHDQCPPRPALCTPRFLPLFYHGITQQKISASLLLKARWRHPEPGYTRSRDVSQTRDRWESIAVGPRLIDITRVRVTCRGSAARMRSGHGEHNSGIREIRDELLVVCEGGPPGGHCLRNLAVKTSVTASGH